MDAKDEISALYNKYYVEQKKTKRGYKYCPCGSYIAARLKVCPECDKIFETGETYTPPVVLTEEEREEQEYIKRVGISGRVTYILAGKCPIEPVLSKKGIFEWCSLLLSDGKVKNRIYMPSLFKYWLNCYAPQEYLKLRGYIDEWSRKVL